MAGKVPGHKIHRHQDGCRIPASGGVPIGTKAGSEITIWLDRSGAIAKPPRQAGDSAAIGTAVGLSAAMMSWLLIAGLARLAVVPLNRRRLREWDRAWAETARRWRQSHG